LAQLDIFVRISSRCQDSSSLPMVLSDEKKNSVN
jgi:hypothetical protein